MPLNEERERNYLHRCKSACKKKKKKKKTDELIIFFIRVCAFKIRQKIMEDLVNIQRIKGIYILLVGV